MWCVFDSPRLSVLGYQRLGPEPFGGRDHVGASGMLAWTGNLFSGPQWYTGVDMTFFWIFSSFFEYFLTFEMTSHLPHTSQLTL